MNIGMTGAVSLVAAAMIGVACGGPQKEPAAQAAPASVDASAPPAQGEAAAPPPVEHPFAKNAAEATGMIDDAVSSRAAPLGKCVDEARARRKDPHAKVTVEIGIDQEGTLLGVKTPKGQPDDKALNDCIQASLKGAPFPKSHSGVITIKKSFEDTVVYK